MPFKSEAQRRKFHAMAARGEISKETVSEWEHATKNKKDLPMHVKKQAASLKIAVDTVADTDKVKAKRTFRGLEIHLDQPKGSTRSWKNDKGEVYFTAHYPHDYGFFPNVIGTDGDHLDVYVGPHEDAQHAYILEKMKRDGKTFDEHKVFVGFKDPDHIKKEVLSTWRGPEYVGKMHQIPFDELHKHVSAGKMPAGPWDEAAAPKKHAEELAAALIQGAQLRFSKQADGVKVAISWGAPTPAAPRPDTRFIGPMRKPTDTMQRIMEAARDQAYEAAASGRLRPQAIDSIVSGRPDMWRRFHTRPDANTLNHMRVEGYERRQPGQPFRGNEPSKDLGQRLRQAIFGGAVRAYSATPRTMPAPFDVRQSTIRAILQNRLSKTNDPWFFREQGIGWLERRIADPRIQRVIERHAPGGMERIRQQIAAVRGEAPVPAFDIKKLRGVG